VAREDELASAIDSLTSWEIDSRRIIVRLIPDALAPAVEVWTAELQMPTSGGSLPLEVMAELKVALESAGPPPPYFLDTERGYTEWGASGVSEVVRLAIGWGLAGVVGNAAYDALRTTVARLAATARNTDNYGAQRSLNLTEAKERGRWAVGSAFELSPTEVDQLRPIAAERVGSSWLVRYRLHDRRYEVELLEEDGLVTIARVGWTERDS
jgi:hypothetical protein